jgi:5-formyltetrahydrofolate cyclo-ligase
MNKLQNIRQQLRKQREQLSSVERNLASQAIVNTILESPVYRSSQRVATYWPVKNEVDTLPFITQALEHGKQVYLPVLSGLNKQFLHFARYLPECEMTVNEFNIPEPQVKAKDLVDPIQLDLVVTPLLGFDEQLNRIGMGGGYYDRTFEFLLTKKKWFKPILVGVAYECQKLPAINSNPWDVPLAQVITQKNLYKKSI